MSQKSKVLSLPSTLLVSVLGKETYVDDVINYKNPETGNIVSREKSLLIASTRFGGEDVYLGKFAQLMTREEIICGFLGLRMGRTGHSLDINSNSSAYDVIKQAHSLAYGHLINALNSTNRKDRKKWNEMNPRSPLEDRLNLASPEATEKLLEQVSAPVKKYISWAEYMHRKDHGKSIKHHIGMKNIYHNTWTRKGGEKERPNYVIPNHAKRIAKILNEFNKEYNPEIQEQIAHIRESRRIAKRPKQKPIQLRLF